ncbi:MAG TPA: hypothetical protein VFE14_00410, partial [Micromonosporaceae bacterium]|nr:hypothetical protein [Micromonosporaceae bacterium]
LNGDQELDVVLLTNLGLADLAAGDLMTAGSHLENALRLRARFPDPLEEARIHAGLAAITGQSSTDFPSTSIRCAANPVP